MLGLIAGAVCALAIELKFKCGFDDSLDVVGIHLVGGLIGTLYLGFFATNTGLFTGGDGTQLLVQAIAAFSVLIYSFVLAYAIGWVIQKTIGFRVKNEDEIAGIDTVVHGEEGYVLTDATRLTFAHSTRGASRISAAPLSRAARVTSVTQRSGFLGALAPALPPIATSDERRMPHPASGSGRSGFTATAEIAPPGRDALRITYAPDQDGDPDAGEIVWTWVPYTENDGRGKDRPVLVIGRQDADRVYAVRLTSKAHDGDRDFLAIGAGQLGRAGTAVLGRHRAALQRARRGHAARGSRARSRAIRARRGRAAPALRLGGGELTLRVVVGDTRLELMTSSV